MTSEDWNGIIIILAIMAIALFGGLKNRQQATSASTQQANTQQQLQNIQSQTNDIQKQVQATKDSLTHSPYFGVISIQYIARSNTANQEYLMLHMNDSSTTTIPISGWTLKSLSSGATVTIPDGTYLIFSGVPNSEDPIVFSPGDSAYVITGISPNGYSFKLNKCSGYMTQFQTFYPSIYTSCPGPKSENESSIPHTVNNDACFDYLDSYPNCKTQTEQFPQNLSPECQNFIVNKMNYSACITDFKNDQDFYSHDWRIYLKRSTTLWKSEREDIVLLDNNGKIVSEYSY